MLYALRGARYVFEQCRASPSLRGMVFGETEKFFACERIKKALTAKRLAVDPFCGENCSQRLKAHSEEGLTVLRCQVQRARSK